MSYPYLYQRSIPQNPALTLEEAKEHLRVDHTHEDDLIKNIITSVYEVAESHLRRTLITTLLELNYDENPPKEIPLLHGPTQNIASVATTDENGQEIIVLAKDYIYKSGKGLLKLKKPLKNIKIKYYAGYGNTKDQIPASIRQGMLAHIAGIFEGRTGGHAVPNSVYLLYLNHRDYRRLI